MEDSEILRLYFERDERAIGETQAKYGTFCLSLARTKFWERRLRRIFR